MENFPPPEITPEYPYFQNLGYPWCFTHFTAYFLLNPYTKSLNMPPNRRFPVTIAERIALRQRYFDSPGLVPSHQELINWFLSGKQ
jgi:hypothetical protein